MCVYRKQLTTTGTTAAAVTAVVVSLTVAAIKRSNLIRRCNKVAAAAEAPGVAFRLACLVWHSKILFLKTLWCYRLLIMAQGINNACEKNYRVRRVLQFVQS